MYPHRATWYKGHDAGGNRTNICCEIIVCDR